MPRSGTSLIEQIAASHSQVFGGGERKDISRIAEAVLGENRDRPVEEWDMEFARQLADRHIAHLQRLSGRLLRVTDKMPNNILHLGIIAGTVPGGAHHFVGAIRATTAVVLFPEVWRRKCFRL